MKPSISFILLLIFTGCGQEAKTAIVDRNPVLTECRNVTECRQQCNVAYDYTGCVAQAGANGINPAICDPVFAQRETCYNQLMVAK